MGLHGAIAFSGLAISTLRGMVDKPSIQIEFAPVDSKPLEALPLGLPPKPAAPKEEPGVPVPRPRRPTR